MSSNSPSGVEFSGAGTGVHGDGFADDEAIADQLADCLTGIGIGDLVGLVRVEPDLAFAAADHCGGQAFLSAEVDPSYCQYARLRDLDTIVAFSETRKYLHLVVVMS